MDLVVSRIRVLQDNYIETAPSALQDFYLGPQVPGIPLTRQKNATLKTSEEINISDNVMDNIYDSENETSSIGNKEQHEGNKEDGIVPIADGIDVRLETDVNEPLTLTLENINTLEYESTSINMHRVRNTCTSLPVTVVDDITTIIAFATAVRQLSLEASSSPSNESINSESVCLSS